MNNQVTLLISAINPIDHSLSGKTIIADQCAIQVAINKEMKDIIRGADQEVAQDLERRGVSIKRAL